VTRSRDEIELAHAILNRAGDARFSQCSFSRRWVLEPESVSVIDGAGRDCLHDLQVVEIASYLRGFGCVDVAVHKRSLEMSVRSVFSFLGNFMSAPMKLVLDGRFRVFRVLPSGLSSMIPMAGGWSIGDYVATISGDGRALELDLFAYLENTEESTWSNTAGIHSTSMSSSSVCEEEFMVRRAHLSLSLEQDRNATQPIGFAPGRCAFMFVDGTVLRSTYRPKAMHKDNQNPRPKLSSEPSAYRAALWSALEWSPLVKVQAKYVSAGLERNEQPQC